VQSSAGFGYGTTMASSSTHLTKSRFLAGRHCPKRLWLSRHEPGLATALSPGTRTIVEMGEEIGRFAHHLFPSGVLVDEHAAAARRTRDLLRDTSVPAIFEAAFEHVGVRIRVDVLERLALGAWGLREVKAAARPKDLYVEDVAVQKLVLTGCGLDVASVELVHVNPGFECGEGQVAWKEFFARVDVGDAVDAAQAEMPRQIAELLAVVAGHGPPNVEPDLHCRTRRPCEVWEHCTRDKASDWILHLPRVTRKQFETLREAGVERIPDIAPDFALQRPQQHMREALCSGEPFVTHDLPEALHETGPPAYYLDFETVNPALPLYRGTRPFQNIPFQWSLHRQDAEGEFSHRHFLATGARDPRRDFVESLLGALDGGSDPILVYSPFESRVLENLAGAFPDLAGGLQAVRARLVDLLPIVRNCVYHVGFSGSFSIKSVAPALAPGFGYEDLDGVVEGGVAAAAFRRIASGTLPPADADRLRAQLLAYCERDTLALVHIHRALRAVLSC
jgi:hypothetical protein